MADHIYEAATVKTSGAAAGTLFSVVPATIASGVRPPEIREIGIFNTTGVACEIGIGYPAAAGTGGISASVTVLPAGGMDGVGHTQLVSLYTTLQPTVPANFLRRAPLQAIIGAGIIWTWLPGEFVLWAGAAAGQLNPVVWQFSALAVGYDCYVKVAE
jgi:hypothetical protein